MTRLLPLAALLVVAAGPVLAETAAWFALACALG